MTGAPDIDFTQVARLGDRLLDQLNALHDADPIHYSERHKSWFVNSHARVLSGIAPAVRCDRGARRAAALGSGVGISRPAESARQAPSKARRLTRCARPTFERTRGILFRSMPPRQIGCKHTIPMLAFVCQSV